MGTGQEEVASDPEGTGGDSGEGGQAGARQTGWPRLVGLQKGGGQ